MTTERVQTIVEHSDRWTYVDGELLDIGPTPIDLIVSTFRQIAAIAVFAPELAAILHAEFQAARGDADREMDVGLTVERMHNDWLYLE